MSMLETMPCRAGGAVISQTVRRVTQREVGCIAVVKATALVRCFSGDLDHAHGIGPVICWPRTIGSVQFNCVVAIGQ